MNWILIANTGGYSYTTDLIELAIIGMVLILSLIGVVEIIRRTLIKVDELEEERERKRAKYPLKLRFLWFIMSLGIRTSGISAEAHRIYNKFKEEGS